MLTQPEIAAIVAENFADDIVLPPDVAQWSVEELTAFCESGGTERPAVQEMSPVRSINPSPVIEATTGSPVQDAGDDEKPDLGKQISGIFSGLGKLFGKSPKK